MQLLFVIRCQEEKYYLGLSNNFVSIFFKHLENLENVDWMNIYKPIELVHIEQFFDIEMLNCCVLRYMDYYGIENVRGGHYSNTVLNFEQYDEIMCQINNDFKTFHKVKC
jgi:hypothetical protein